MKPLRALLILTIGAAVLAGTAGLASPRGHEYECLDHWALDETSTRDFAQPISLWPPGVRCQLVEADGTVVDERDTSVVGFLALLALWVGVLVLLLRSRSPAPIALRVAAIAAAGLLTWGVASLGAGPFFGAVISILYLAAPIAGFAVDRRLRRAGGGAARWTDGVLGLLLAPVAILRGLFAWMFGLGPPAYAVPVALLAAAAAVVDRAARGFARRWASPA